MKWYKHHTNTEASGLITELVEALGITGYGLFFRLLEVLASKCEAPDWGTGLRLTRAGWRSRLYCTAEALQKFIDVVEEWAAADAEAGHRPPLEIKENGKWLEISAPKLLDYADRYTADASGARGRGQARGRSVKARGQAQPEQKMPMVCAETAQTQASNSAETAQKVHLIRLDEIRLDQNRSSSSADEDEDAATKTPEFGNPWAGIPEWLVNTGQGQSPAALQRAFPFYPYAEPSPHLVERVADILTRYSRTRIEAGLAVCGANAARSIGYLEAVLKDQDQKTSGNNGGSRTPPPASKFAYNPRTNATRLFRDQDTLEPGEELL